MNNHSVCGTGDGDGDGSYIIPGCADDAAALMDALDQGPWYVAGYSMSGMIAQELAGILVGWHVSPSYLPPVGEHRLPQPRRRRLP